MKKIVLILLITITSLSCNKSEKKIDYANILENCFPENDIEILNEACTLFESNLNEHYQNKPIGIEYKLYLKEFSSNDKQVDVIKKPTKQFLNKLKNSNMFNEIWTTFAETYYEDARKHQQKSENNLFVINPNGKYLKCLINNQKNKCLNEYLMTIKKFSIEKYIMTQSIASAGLSKSMLDKDYDDKTVRLIIAMNFYYEFELNKADK